MKKVALIVAILICLVFLLSSCGVGNRQTGIDTIQSFDRFTIIMGDDVIKGTVKQWRDYEDSDVIQIVASDGTVYLTHYMNVLMVRDKR